MGHTGTGPIGSSNAPYRHPDLGPEIEFPFQSSLKPLGAEPKPSQLPSRIMRESFSLASGEIQIFWPGAVSKDEMEDVRQWMDMIARKMQRADSGPIVIPNQHNGD